MSEELVKDFERIFALGVRREVILIRSVDRLCIVGLGPGLRVRIRIWLFEKFRLPSKPSLLPYSLATFRRYCDQSSALRSR